MKIMVYASVTREKILDTYKSITRWKKTLIYSTISHLMILFGIIVVYTFYNKDFKAVDSMIITGVYLGLLVTTYIMMYIIFKKRLA
jgi:hypothetical protein